MLERCRLSIEESVAQMRHLLLVWVCVPAAFQYVM
jgi:hypothetical protein